jgi:hypothetical protein
VTSAPLATQRKVIEMKISHQTKSRNNSAKAERHTDIRMWQESPLPPAPLTIKQLADRWGLTPNTLCQWRSQRRGPDYIKLGRKTVVYPIDAILAFERDGRLASLI